MASDMQKNYIERKKVEVEKKDLKTDLTKPNPVTFKSNPYNSYNYRHGMRI